jgi:predicted DNA-binding transcriptional regulator AlpA
MPALELVPEDAPERLTTQQLAKLLGIPPPSVLLLAKRGDLPPPLRLTRKRIWFDTAAVRAHLKSRIRATPLGRRTRKTKHATNGG